MNRAGQYALATAPALVILGFFVWFANWIPQTRWAPPQRHEMSADMTPAQMAAIGQTIARQRGCMACHTIEPGVGAKGGGRGPNWADLAVRRAQGVPEGPGTLVDYLVQALYDPGAYLVEGYANIMPAATTAPAKLSYEEVVAVINYLQSLGGKPSVRLGDIPRAAGMAGPGAASAQSPLHGAETSTEPATILSAFGCAACHSLKAGEVLVGPSLDAASLRTTADEQGMTPEAYVMESIVSPAAYERQGLPPGVMPPDFGARLTAAQLQALVTYLLSTEAKR